jgi:hypothetical protein
MLRDLYLAGLQLGMSSRGWVWPDGHCSPRHSLPFN